MQCPSSPNSSQQVMRGAANMPKCTRRPFLWTPVAFSWRSKRPRLKRSTMIKKYFWCRRKSSYSARSEAEILSLLRGSQVLKISSQYTEGHSNLWRRSWLSMKTFQCSKHRQWCHTIIKKLKSRKIAAVSSNSSWNAEEKTQQVPSHSFITLAATCPTSKTTIKRSHIFRKWPHQRHLWKNHTSRLISSPWTASKERAIVASNSTMLWNNSTMC